MIPSTQQQAIFDWFKRGTGNLIVRARAGTGKTTTIVAGVEYAAEPRILVCAFNKRMQIEIAGKLTCPRAEAKTLHSVGFRFVRRAWPEVRLDEKDNRAQVIARKAIAKVSGVQEGEISDEVVLGVHKLVSLAKNTMPRATAEQLIDLADVFDAHVEAVEDTALGAAGVLALELTKTRDGWIGFDDMIYLPVVQNWIRPSYEMTVVDEAQDMNVVQLEMAQRVTQGRMVIVGDDRQALYAFRGADTGALNRLKAALRAQELPLTTSYRCPKSVIRAAAELVPDFKAPATAPEGSVNRITENYMLSVISDGDFLLSRTNAPLAKFCLRLIRDGKPAKIEGRDVSKSLAALVKRRRATNILDLSDRLHAWARYEEGRLKATKRANVQVRIDAIHDQVETIEALSDGLTTVKELLERIHDFFESAAVAPIVCSTVHRAKGLESDRVFVLEDTLYLGGNRHTLEEENIHYVAITRAKRELYLVYDPDRKKSLDDKQESLSGVR